MAEVWTVEQEAQHLRRRFEAVRNKAAFARQHGIPGGPSMQSQHLSGHRPMSLDAAVAYAKGFGVPLREISPRLANGVAAAHAVAEPLPGNGPDLSSPHVVSDADWELLQDMNDAMTMPEYASVIQKIRGSVSALREHVLARARERFRAVQDAGGGHVGGMSAFGDLGSQAPPAPKERRHNKKREGK